MIGILCQQILRRTKPGLKFPQRGISNKISTKSYKEVEIDVPWGKLTGKHWGSTNVQPIIAIHGWQDNAASFDPLMNYMSDDIPILAIDLPGHGYSSWLPNGLMYNFLFYTQIIDRLRQHYDMEKISIIAHSMGGMVSFNYASYFPNNVKFVVALDYFKPPYWDMKKYHPRFANEWNDFFKLEKKMATAPHYKEADAVQKSIKASGNSLNETSCKILYARGVEKYPDGTITFRRDPRLKYFTLSNGFMHEYLKLLAERIQCPYRILKGDSCDYNEPEETYYDVMKVVEKHSKDFKFQFVPGTHHFHMDNPEAVAEIINPFIDKYHRNTL